MKAILKQLYGGEIYPAEQFYPKVKEYKALRRKNFVHYKSFTKKLETISPELSQEFTQIMDEQLSVIPLEVSEMFIDGFRLGAKMVIEVYGNDITDEK